MNLTDEQRAAILDEIIAITEPPKRKDYQFTAREYAERAGLSKSGAMKKLGKVARTGLLKRERVLVDCQWTYVYWRPEDELQRESQASHKS